MRSLPSRPQATCGAWTPAEARRARLPRRRLASAVLATAVCCPVTGHALGASAVAGSAGGDAGRSKAIPKWRLDAEFMPSRSMDDLRAEKSQARELPAVPKGGPPAGGPAGAGAVGDGSRLKVQDEQRCPVVRLTQRLNLDAGYMSWSGQAGSWRVMPSAVKLASWEQSYFSQAWGTVFFRDLDGRQAVRAEDTTDEQLFRRFGWKAGHGPDYYPKVVELQARWEAVVRAGRLWTKTWPNDAGVTHVVAMHQPASTWSTVVILDCEGRLMFVVKLQKSARFPGAVDVYDNEGSLLAHSVTDVLVERHQFIDTEGYLLATAEAPGLGRNVSFQQLPRDSARGGIFAYELQFEHGGYNGASQLLEEDYRWVLAAVVQLRAIHDGWGENSPALPQILPVAYWLAAAVLVVAVAGSCLVSNRMLHMKLASPLDSPDKGPHPEQQRQEPQGAGRAL